MVIDIDYYCVVVRELIDAPNNIFVDSVGIAVEVWFVGWGHRHLNAEDADIEDVVEVYALCDLDVAHDPSIMSRLSSDNHYIRRVSEKIVTVTETRTSTVTSYTIVTSNTVTRTTTGTKTDYITQTAILNVTKTYTITQTTTTTTATARTVHTETITKTMQRCQEQV